MELGVGAHEYSLTCQIWIGWKHHVICWLVWQESACDAFLLIGRALGWWAWSARDHCMHFARENAGELEMTESTLFWQLHAYNQLLNLLHSPFPNYWPSLSINPQSLNESKTVLQKQNFIQKVHKWGSVKPSKTSIITCIITDYLSLHT